MKTTIDLPDDAVRSIRLKAAREGRSMKDVMTEVLRRGLAATVDGSPGRRRAAFPLVECPPGPPAGLSPDEVAEVLVDADANAVVG